VPIRFFLVSNPFIAGHSFLQGPATLLDSLGVSNPFIAGHSFLPSLSDRVNGISLGFQTPS